MYVPTGTMSNQVAIRTHTEPGDYVLCANWAHINHHEMGAGPALSGVTIRELEAERGIFTADAVRAAMPLRSESEPASLIQPVTLVAAENTHNLEGGAIWPLQTLVDMATTAGSFGLRTHLDGARLWNASAATGVPESEYAAPFDTVSVCFSKGLGAPMGSALVGKQEHIDRARRFKQMFGGGFRQAGMMAAGALYAVKNHRQRLAEDHANATRLAAGIAEIAGLEVDTARVETNMIYFTVLDRPATEFVDACFHSGIIIRPESPKTIRVVLHLGVSAGDVDTVLKVFADSA
jgi:threonine aldolase